MAVLGVRLLVGRSLAAVLVLPGPRVRRLPVAHCCRVVRALFEVSSWTRWSGGHWVGSSGLFCRGLVFCSFSLEVKAVGTAAEGEEKLGRLVCRPP